jgi:hypothetical protein
MTGWKRGVGVAVVAASLGAVVWAQDVPARVRMTAEEASTSFVRAVAGNGPSYSRQAAQAFMALSPAARATLVRDGFAWARAYSTSPAFKAAYEKIRQSRKPTEKTFDTTVDEELAKRQAKEKKDLDDALAAFVNLPAADRKQMEEVVRQAAAQMKDPQMIAAVRQSIVGEREEARKDYEDSMASWQKDFPADPQALIAERLQMILKESDGIDFTAKTRVSGGRTEFVEATFESKPDPWKMAFRAGEPAVTAARAAATDWLKALPKP